MISAALANRSAVAPWPDDGRCSACGDGLICIDVGVRKCGVHAQPGLVSVEARDAGEWETDHFACSSCGIRFGAPPLDVEVVFS